MRRKVMAAGDFHRKAAIREGLYAVMLTITYRPGASWRARHVAELLGDVRKWHQRAVGKPLRYVWVAELQEGRMARRGETAAQCMHYHVVLWLPNGLKCPKPDVVGWWPHGMTKIEEARQPVGYLLKYTSKGTGEPFPRGARICGAGGLERSGRLHVRWWLLPRYVREVCTVDDNVHRCHGGGWVSLTTGQWWPPWGADGWG